MAKAKANWVIRAAEQKKSLRKQGIARKLARKQSILLVANLTTEISNADALKGVDAQWDALDILFDTSSDEIAKRGYVDQINVLEKEHTILTNKKLHEAWDTYKQSAQIGKSAEKLRASATEIEEQAKTLTQLASFVDAINKFVKALKG